MLELFTKDNTKKKIAEEEDLSLFYKTLKFNSSGDKYNITLRISKNGEDGSPDKATLFIFGNHNGSIFASILNVSRGGTYENAKLLGGVTIASCSQYDNNLRIRVVTNIYGSIAVLSTCEIIDVFGSN